MTGVSSCLAGIKCRYNGTAKPDQDIIQMVREGKAVVFCPECLVGLKIPRAPSEIKGGDGYDVLTGKAKVFSKDGKDLTEEFVAAAQKSLDFCRKKGITKVYLKSKSPSCGVSRIYDGTFTDALISGSGVTSAFLLKNGIDVHEID